MEIESHSLLGVSSAPRSSGNQNPVSSTSTRPRSPSEAQLDRNSSGYAHVPNDENTVEWLDMETGSSVWDATFNFTNSIVGAGIIGLPYSFYQAGFVSGSILLISLAWLVDYTVGLLVIDAKLSGQNTYQGLIRFCYGSRGFLAISIFQFIFAYGALCAYTVILGDVFPVAFSALLSSNSVLYPILTSRGWIITLCTLFVSLPLSLYRDISALARTSALSLAMIVFIVLAVVGSGIFLPMSEKGNLDLRWSFLNPGVFQAIGVISFAFVCHHNTFLIYTSLKKPTMDRFATVTHLSTGASLILCFVMACGGFLVFTDKTKANILTNFEPTHLLVNLARIGFGFNMFLTYPLEAFVCREVVFNYLFADPKASNESIVVSNTQHVGLTVLLVSSSWIIAMSTCNLGFLLEITGGFAATVIAYILPAACFLKLSSGPVLSFKKLGPICIAVFGIVVMFLSTFLSIRHALTAPSRSC